MSIRPFHHAFAVSDLDATKQFYVGLLGSKIGRTDARWIDFDLYGHQITAHLLETRSRERGENPVDGDAVPIPHFGVILELGAWKALAAQLGARDDIDWIIAPKVRFEGETGEQATMFFRDPSGNALEFKAFADDAMIFDAGGATGD
ncbi:MAG: VOC family protein [Pseudomonadota bacterium]